MKLWEVIVVIIGLALEPFNEALKKGANQWHLKKVTLCLVSLLFAVIQTIMLGIGMITISLPMQKLHIEGGLTFIPFLAALILIFLSMKMFRRTFREHSFVEKREEVIDYKGLVKSACILGVDAIIIGILLALLQLAIIKNLVLTFGITSISVALGLWMGYRLGMRYHVVVNGCSGCVLLIIAFRLLMNCF